MIILCAPYLSVERLNENLEAFGYQPLDETHTQIDGTYLDWLLIRDPENICGLLQREKSRGMHFVASEMFSDPGSVFCRPENDRTAPYAL